MLWIVFDLKSVIESVKMCITVLKSSKVTYLPADENTCWSLSVCPVVIEILDIVLYNTYVMDCFWL